MPAAASSSSLVPEPGISRTARWVIHSFCGPAPSRVSFTAEPSPPSGWWSSATTMRPFVTAAAATRVSVSTGLMEYKSMTRAWMSSAARRSAAARQACKVTPAPIRVTTSRWLERSTLDPPIGNVSAVS